MGKNQKNPGSGTAPSAAGRFQTKPVFLQRKHLSGMDALYGNQKAFRIRIYVKSGDRLISLEKRMQAKLELFSDKWKCIYSLRGYI